MPRKRTIDPNFWNSETIGCRSRDHRLLFIGLFSNADDYGRFQASARRVRRLVFPYDDDLTDEQVEGWLLDLTEDGLIRRWRSPGGSLGEGSPNPGEVLGEIPTWDRHQKVKYPSQPRLPAYKGEPQILRQPSPNPGGSLPQSSPNLPPKEERRGEERVKRRELRKNAPPPSESEPTELYDSWSDLPLSWQDRLLPLARRFESIQDFKPFAWITQALQGKCGNCKRRFSPEAIERVLQTVEPEGPAKNLYAVLNSYLNSAQELIDHERRKRESKEAGPDVSALVKRI